MTPYLGTTQKDQHAFHLLHESELVSCADESEQIFQWVPFPNLCYSPPTLGKFGCKGRMAPLAGAYSQNDTARSLLPKSLPRFQWSMCCRVYTTL